MRSKDVVDGKQVNIPVPASWSDGVTKKGRSAGLWIVRFKPVGGKGWKIRPFSTPRSEYEGL